MINDSKTEFLIIDTRQQLEKTSIESVTIGDTVIKPLEGVRNLALDPCSMHMCEWMFI